MSPKTAAKAAPTQPGVERAIEINAGMATLLFFIVALLYFLPAFMPGQHIYGSDYIQAGYMMYDFARQRIASGHLPLWVPYVYGGLPIFANPGSIFHPIRLLADVTMPSTWALPFICVVQFTLAGLGMYLLLRELRARTWVALVTGFAFQLTGITISAVYAGHDGRIIVATLAPMFFFFLHKGVRTGALSAFVGAAATLGSALLSFQIQTNYYLLLAAAAWALFALVHLGIVRTPRALATRTALGLGAVAFGFAIAAVNFLPFREYVSESPRGTARGYEYSTTWSLPPAEALGVAVPEHAGVFDDYRGKNPFKLNTEYLGAFVLVMLVLGGLVARRNRHWWFFLGLAAVALTIAFGGHTPLYRLYYEILPGTQRFRAPSTAFFLVALSLITMAGLTLERIAQVRDEGRTAQRTSTWIGWGLGAIAGLAALAAALAGVLGTASATAQGMGRFALFTLLVCGALWLWRARLLPTTLFAILLSVIVIADLLVVNRKFFTTVDGPEVMWAEDALINFLRTRPQPDRIWILPAKDWTDSNVLMLYGVEQAGGEHGNQLQRWNEYAGTSGSAYIDWSNFSKHDAFVNAANIKWVVSRADLRLAADTLRLAPRHRMNGFVYENKLALPRAYLVEQAVATPDTMAALKILAEPDIDVRRTAVVYTKTPLGLAETPLEGGVQVLAHEPDLVRLRATSSRPALLVLADNWHKDWVATVNGKEMPVLRANHTFRGVVVGAGQSDVVFAFKPRSLFIGFYIYLSCLVLLATYTAWLVVARLRARTTQL